MNNTTEIVFILDRSGSMACLEADVIGGFNATITRQKKEEGKAYVTTVLFDDRYEVLHDRIDLHEVKELDATQYYVRGCTALLDAIGKTIAHIDTVHRYIRPEDVPDHTMVIINTDGMENASREFDNRMVRKMVQEHQDKGWEFLFLGANIDSYAVAGSFGLSEKNITNYMHDRTGMHKVFEDIGEAICEMRTVGSVGADWKMRTTTDYESRKR